MQNYVDLQIKSSKLLFFKCAQTCLMQRLFCFSLIPYGENIEFHINNNSFYRYFLWYEQILLVPLNVISIRIWNYVESILKKGKKLLLVQNLSERDYITISNWLWFIFSVSGRWSTWHDSSHCSVSCGGGLRTRTRSCHHHHRDHKPKGGHHDHYDYPCQGPTTRTEACNTQPCPGYLSSGSLPSHF